MISRDTVINSTIKTADTTTMPAIAPTGTLLLDSASVAVGTDGVTVGASVAVGTDGVTVGVTVGASVADGVTVCVVGVEPLQSTSKYSQPVNSGVGERQLMRLFSVPFTAARVLNSPV